MNRFRDFVSQIENPSSLKLWLDIVTRWNSTYLMLKRALRYRVAVNRFGSTEPDYTLKLTDSEWELVANMASIRGVLFNSEQGCKAKYHLRRACESEDTCIRETGNEMFEKLERYLLEMFNNQVNILYIVYRN
ncbi:unnamed protein product [Amaranthus hypochondriacus]